MSPNCVQFYQTLIIAKLQTVCLTFCVFVCVCRCCGLQWWALYGTASESECPSLPYVRSRHLKSKMWTCRKTCCSPPSSRPWTPWPCWPSLRTCPWTNSSILWFLENVSSTTLSLWWVGSDWCCCCGRNDRCHSSVTVKLRLVTICCQTAGYEKVQNKKHICRFFL